jgi:RNA polymerase sigma factor for flagellar operon FliA
VNSTRGGDVEPSRNARHAINAREALIRQHIGLVNRIADHFARRVPRQVETDDLVQAGMMSLVEASQRYVAARSASFETYAGIRIRGGIADYLRRADWSPRRLYRRLRNITAVKEHIESDTGRTRTPFEVAALEISLDAYHHTLRDADASRLRSLDEPSALGTAPLAERVVGRRAGPAAEVERADLRRAVAAAISALPENESLALLLQYDQDLLLREIGDKLKVSESRTCKLRKRAIERLQKVVRSWTYAGGTAATLPVGHTSSSRQTSCPKPAARHRRPPAARVTDDFDRSDTSMHLAKELQPCKR